MAHLHLENSCGTSAHLVAIGSSTVLTSAAFEMDVEGCLTVHVAPCREKSTWKPADDECDSNMNIAKLNLAKKRVQAVQAALFL